MTATGTIPTITLDDDTLAALKHLRSPRFEVPAFDFARAWLNASLASGEDDARPVLYRTVALELFADRVQLVATDSYMLLRAAVRHIGADPVDGIIDDGWPPDNELPERTIVVADTEKMGRALMGVIHRLAKPKDGDPSLATITVTVEQAPAKQATLDDEHMAARHVVLEAFDQRLALPTIDGAFPPWRNLELGAAPELIEGLRFGTDVFGRLGKLKGVSCFDADFQGDAKPVLLTAREHWGAGDVIVRGIAMPVRRADKAARKTKAEPDEDGDE